MSLVDIIIPAYNAHETLPQTLASIASQTISDKVSVYVCNDAGAPYTEIVKWFKSFIDVHELTVPKNGGCGVARQYGIDHSTSKYFTCMDADDTFMGPFSLQSMVLQMESNPNAAACFSRFVEESENGYITHACNDPWMHGKIYRREFMESNNIRFNLTRANEDGRFNRLVTWLADKAGQDVLASNDIVYMWINRPNSTVRKNNCEYAFNQSIEGYVDNYIEFIDEIMERIPEKAHDLLRLRVEVLCSLYFQCITIAAARPEFKDKVFGYAQKFYNASIKPVQDQIAGDFYHEFYTITMTDGFVNQEQDPFIPYIEFWNWLEALKNGTN